MADGTGPVRQTHAGAQARAIHTCMVAHISGPRSSKARWYLCCMDPQAECVGKVLAQALKRKGPTPEGDLDKPLLLCIETQKRAVWENSRRRASCSRAHCA